MNGLDLTEAIAAGRAAIRGHHVCEPDASTCSCYDLAITAAAPLIEKAVRQDVEQQLVRGRCWSCDHVTDEFHHDPEGCRYTVTQGAAGVNLVCTCSAIPSQVTATDPPASIGRTGANREEAP